jgi:hypothetical protein
VIAIIAIIFLIILFSGSGKKDIEIDILGISYENNQYNVNISFNNNQDQTGWISDTYLKTVEGSVIYLTGAGVDEKVESGETKYLKLFSADVAESITDPPLTLNYTVFPSGNSYSVEI